MRTLCITFLVLVFSTHAFGQQLVVENIHEPRVRELAAVLRCPVCQSENILDSQASIAREMMILLREQVEAGADDKEIIQFFRQRYGDYVLLQPATDGAGLFLWLLPIGFCVAFALVGFQLTRTSRRNPPPESDLLDEQRLDEMEV